MATSQHPNLKLNSPAYVEPILYKWPLQKGTGAEQHDSGIEILDTIRWVCDDMPEIKAALEHITLADIDTSCYESMRSVCDTYNRAIDSIAGLERGTSLTEQRLNKFASRDLLRHVIQLVYNTAVVEPDKLNKYESFSPEVYGETSFELVCQMIDQISISKDDVFIDLGSGVGQVVLQMAGALQVKSCIGIERAEVPSQYAVDMDSTFRRWMRWFGKKFNEFELIKGDFLADEHREKINSATIVFVNNFAFGPTVDHQLKERFADLRDGARIVSSKSFCPLNFRITERNLSDIGTIIHVSEMSSLRGSVSWTDRPVSYYLHVIDRTKLERYFQRLKNHKGSDDGSNHSRSNRSTRNNNSLKDDNTTDSDNEVLNGNNNRATRRAWAEIASYKDKSSHSDDEENNNGSRNGKNGNAKRKKLTRKAAAKAAQQPTNNTQTNGVQKKRLPKANNNATGVTTISNKKGGRKRNFKIVGLDLLHSHTLSSTSSDVIGKKLPPAPGCVDQQLTSLSGNMTHEELEIPTAPSETPYALQILLDLFRNQFMHQLEQMRSSTYKDSVNKQISDEKERNKNLLNRVNQLEKQIKVLIDDSVALLKARMNELGIEMTSQNDLLAKAKEIVGRHKELQVMAAKLQTQVTQIERDQNHMIHNQVQSIATKWSKGEPIEINPQTSHEMVLKEIASTLSYRKKLQARITSLEHDMNSVENTANVTPSVAVVAAAAAAHTNVVDEKKATTITPVNHVPANNMPVSSQTSTSYAGINYPPAAKPVPTATKSQRKSRENRTRSQEKTWPDIPDVGKIEENNPEILAQKILETGRQIEAGRLLANNSYSGKHKEPVERERKNAAAHHTGDATLMPAPTVVVKSSSRNNSMPQAAPPMQQQKHAPKHTVQDAPKVVNFEDRLKSIITTVLNEDQEQRKAQTKPSNASSSQSSQQQQQQQQQQHQQSMAAAQQQASIYAKAFPAAAVNQSTPPAHLFNNQNLISGTHQLNAATTISAVKPSINNMPTNANKQPTDTSYAMISNKFSPGNGKYSQSSIQPSHASHLNHSLPSHQYQPPSQGVPHQMAPHHPHKQQPPMANYQKSHSESSSQPRHSPIAGYPHHREKITIDVHHQSPHNGREHMQHTPTQFGHHIDVKNEFKTPEKMRFERMANHNLSTDEHNANRAFIAENMMAYNSSSRPSSTSSASSGHHNLNRQMISATPPSPSPSNVPDYTQVSPAKMALRRHLSQEKISQQFGPIERSGSGGGGGNGPMSSKTIGDLVNGEIERTLEISHQSIINAAINMSSMGTAHSGGSSGAVINANAQRPERVNVRVMDELMAPVEERQHIEANRRMQAEKLASGRWVVTDKHSFMQQHGPMPNSAAYRGREITKSPVHLHGQSNLATLAHVAHNHRQMTQHPGMPAHHPHAQQPPPREHHVTKPLTIQTISPRLSTSAQFSPASVNQVSPASSHSSRSSYSSARQNEPSQPTKYMPLPRADMKANWESYFNESNQARAQPNQPQPSKHPKGAASENHRNNGAPLEGLAASLQERVIAHMKIKEEDDERLKRTDISPMPMHNGNVTITPAAHIKTEVSSSLKRSSPIVQQHHRAAKIRPNYSNHSNHINDSLLSPSENHRDRMRANELMSPEINSMLPDDRAHIRPKDDDGMICIDDGDDESRWKHCVSSGFDRLVAFASIELTKSRRSIEDGGPSTSPDSGINQSSDGRTFLSSSSSSSQLDAPTNLLRTVVPIMKSSPAEVLESPPPSQTPEMPRTPSPTSSPPPNYSAQSPEPYDPIAANDMHFDGDMPHLNSYHIAAPEPNLKIPLKYQRQSKTSAKHYKKKFRERTWEYDEYEKEELIGGANDGIDDFADGNVPYLSSHHKSSKFWKKGKGNWDWKNQEEDPANFQ